MLRVASIPASVAWYRTVVGLVPGHGGDEFEFTIADLDGYVVAIHTPFGSDD
jgi:hypothetical protein